MFGCRSIHVSLSSLHYLNIVYCFSISLLIALVAVSWLHIQHSAAKCNKSCQTMDNLFYCKWATCLMQFAFGFGWWYITSHLAQTFLCYLWHPSNIFMFKIVYSVLLSCAHSWSNLRAQMIILSAHTPSFIPAGPCGFDSVVYPL